MKSTLFASISAAALLSLGACANSEDTPSSTPESVAVDSVPTDIDEAQPDETTVQMFPDVIGATATQTGDTWTIAATLSSPYDSSERYADAFRIVSPDGTVLGERTLTHDHADEQPFTRAESNVAVPDDVSTLTIEGRDLEFGYGGATYELTIVR